MLDWRYETIVIGFIPFILSHVLQIYIYKHIFQEIIASSFRWAERLHLLPFIGGKRLSEDKIIFWARYSPSIKVTRVAAKGSQRLFIALCINLGGGWWMWCS